MTPTQKRRARRQRQLEALQRAVRGPSVIAVQISSPLAPGAVQVVAVPPGTTARITLGTLTQVPIDITILETR